MIDGVNVEGCLIIPCKVERINMISIQDLYAIKDIIESHFNSCTRGEEAKNLANIIDDEIDKVSNIEDWACFDEKKTPYVFQDKKYLLREINIKKLLKK